MKKKIMGLIAVVAIATVAGYNVYTSQNNNGKLSDLALANVEALADPNESSQKGCKLNLLHICETAHSDHYLYRNR